MNQLEYLQEEYFYYLCILLDEKCKGSKRLVYTEMIHSVLDDLEKAQSLSNVKTNGNIISKLLNYSSKYKSTIIKGKYDTIHMN